MELVYTPVIGIVRSLFFVQGLKFTISGTHFVPRKGGAVVAINHISYLDYMYAGLAARPSGRVIRFMAKEVVFRHPVSAPLMKGMKHIPVDRESGASAYQAAVQALKDGELVGVFPEATISRSFELKTFKSGAIRMALDAQVPVIPIVVWGSQRIWTKGHPKRLGRTNVPVTIAVGEPLPIPAGTELDAGVALLHERMAGMLAAARDSYEPLTGSDAVFLPASMGGRAPTLAEANEMDQADIAARRAARAAKQAAKDAANPPQDGSSS